MGSEGFSSYTGLYGLMCFHRLIFVPPAFRSGFSPGLGAFGEALGPHILSALSLVISGCSGFISTSHSKRIRQFT